MNAIARKALLSAVVLCCAGALHALENAGPGVLAIHQQMAASTQVPADERHVSQGGLGHDAQLSRKRGEQNRHVVDTRMVGDEDAAVSCRRLRHAADLDMTKAKRPGQEQKRVNVDFPLWMVRLLDKEAKRLGVPRQSIIKVWVAERLDKAS